MTQFQFTITDYTTNPAGDTTVIEEPVGWDGLTMKLSRNKEWHGFFDYFDASISMLEFDYEGFTILKAAYELIGVDANVELLIEFRCSDTDVFEEIYTGRFDFATYEQICSDRCYIKINVETTSCLVKLKNRYDQKVDLESLRTFDLPDGDADDLSAYAGLGFEMTLDPNEIYVESRWGEPQTEILGAAYTGNDLSGVAFYYRPGFAAFQSDIPDTISSDAPDSDPVSGGSGDPFMIQLPYVDVPNPTNLNVVNLEMSFNLEGNFTDRYISGDTTGDVAITGGNGLILVISKGSNPTSATTIHQENNVVAAYSIGSGADHNVAFSISGTFTIASIAPGEKIYINFIWVYHVENVDFSTLPVLEREFEWEYTTANIELNGFIFSEPTNSKVFLINETLSRTAEIVTDDCLRVYSDYFGRTDAEPYTSADESCGSFEVVTNGLNIRRALNTDDSEPKFNVSMKSLFEGLNAIHNIGMGVEPDPNRPGYEWLRIEKFQYFYDTTVLLTLDKIAKVTREINRESLFSIFKSGYQKFETETSGGLNDIHTHRNFRTTLQSISKTLEKVCPFIASGHSIEVTRWQVGNTSEDWRYDTDTFIISVKRDGTYLNDYRAERGENMPTADNLPGYQTCYNVNISPQRNARRWVPIIFQCYADYANGIMKFMDGDGNLIASTFIDPTDVALCITQDDTVPFANMPENADISLSPTATAPFDADNVEIFYPIFKPERILFEYPLSYEQWKLLKAAPTGLIGYECGGTTEYGWIDELNYRPVEGMADFVLIPKQPELLGIGG